MASARTPSYLVFSEVLQALGIAADTRSASFRFERVDGTVTDRLLVALERSAEPEWVQLPDPALTPLPLYRQRPDLNYWYVYLPNDQAVYLKYNRCSDIPGQPFFTVGQEIGTLIDTQNVEKIVLDLRDNGGGNSSVLQPLITGVQSMPGLNRPDRFFVIIGRSTFSSAMLNAIQLDLQTNATLIGEPTGGKPNSYGEVLTFVLPYSGLTVAYSTKYFQQVPGDPPSLYPEIMVTMPASAYFAGRDPVLESVLPRGRRRVVSH